MRNTIPAANVEKTNQVKVYHPGSQHVVGDGFHVRNLFPSNDLDHELSPFIMLDYAGPTFYPATDTPRGVGEHPHRGFETVTIVYQGIVAHRDSAGNSGVIGPGDVQWMTAASGIVHEELHEKEWAKQGGTLQMIQLWVNLPKSSKMSAPGYQTIVNDQIPVVQLDGGAGSLRVIAGSVGGEKARRRHSRPSNCTISVCAPGIRCHCRSQAVTTSACWSSAVRHPSRDRTDYRKPNWQSWSRQESQ